MTTGAGRLKATKAGALPSSSPGSGAGRTKATPDRERALQMARSILDQAHALQIQSMGDLGHIRDLDRTLAGTLMAEFSPCPANCTGGCG